MLLEAGGQIDWPQESIDAQEDAGVLAGIRPIDVIQLLVDIPGLE
ncbi:MAG: hypothetical protein WDM77_15280 [Steroidobacteraceae bacterium]